MSNLIMKSKIAVIGLFKGLCKGKGKGRILRVFTIGYFKGKSQGYSVPIRDRIPFTLKPDFCFLLHNQNTLLCINHLNNIMFKLPVNYLNSYAYYFVIKLKKVNIFES